mgnify:CR=1 FL=1
MSDLFSPLTVGNLVLPNRILMAALTRARSGRSHIPNALMAEYYAQRASAGLIITEATAISHQGQGYSDVPGIWSDAQVAAWRPVTEGVHAAGGKIVVQLWHVGRVSHVDLQPVGAAPVAPSAIAAKTKTVLIKDGVPRFVETSEPRALRADELPGIVADYRHAARCAAAAGFDGVEVHASNGYLLDQFLRSSSNHRTDAYGGAIENRARLLLEVMQAIALEIGGARVGIRLSPVTPANDVFDAHPQPLFEYVARHLGWEARREFAPEAVVRPGLHPVAKCHLHVVAAEHGAAHAGQRKAAWVVGVGDVGQRRGARHHAQPAEGVGLLEFTPVRGRNGLAADAVEAVAARNDVAIEPHILAVMAQEHVRFVGPIAPATKRGLLGSRLVNSSATSLAIFADW